MEKLKSLSLLTPGMETDVELVIHQALRHTIDTWMQDRGKGKSALS